MFIFPMCAEIGAHSLLAGFGKVEAQPPAIGVMIYLRPEDSQALESRNSYMAIQHPECKLLSA